MIGDVFLLFSADSLDDEYGFEPSADAVTRCGSMIIDDDVLPDNRDFMDLTEFFADVRPDVVDDFPPFFEPEDD